jgi:hypothetical protein
LNNSVNDTFATVIDSSVSNFPQDDTNYFQDNPLLDTTAQSYDE